MNVAIVAMVNTTTSSANGSVPFEQCPPVDSKGFDVRFVISESGVALYSIPFSPTARHASITFFRLWN